MKKNSYFIYSLFICAILFGCLTGANGYADIAIIVNKQNPLSSISVDELRKIYYKKTTKWQTGQKIEVFELGKGNKEKGEFTQLVFKMSIEALEREYTKMELSGSGEPPKTAASPEEMISVIAANPNAIGYVDATKAAQQENIKILTISGITTSSEINAVLSGAFSSSQNSGYYEKLASYLSKKIGSQFKITGGMSYEIGAKLLQSEKANVGFLSGYTYMRKKDILGSEVLAAPVMSNSKYEDAPKYYSYIIAPNDSEIKTFADLKGKKFLFADPLSNSGYNIVRYELAKMGYKITGFFKEAQFSGSHEKSIEMISKNLADAAAISSLIWDSNKSVSQELRSKIKIIAEFPAGSAPVITISKKLPLQIKSSLKETLLNMSSDSEATEILSNLQISHFAEITEDKYNEILEKEKFGIDFEKNN